MLAALLFTTLMAVTFLLVAETIEESTEALAPARY
jgi:hypothetical protein